MVMGELRRLPTAGEGWSTVQQVMKHFGVGRSTVYRWQNQGMPSVSLGGGARRYRLSECKDWLEGHKLHH